MSWSIEFDEPIELAKGKTLRTLRDAAEHITALPRVVAELRGLADCNRVPDCCG